MNGQNIQRSLFSPADDSDFDSGSFGNITVTNATFAEVSLFAYDDDVTLEYNDSVMLTFTPDDVDLIASIEAAGEFIRYYTTVNIIDNDRKCIIYN